MIEELMRLLKHWAELEPERCEITQNTCQVHVRGFAYRLDQETASLPVQLMRLQIVLQSAIRDQGVRLRLEDDGDRWYVTLIHPEIPASAFTAQNNEPAIALLTAYVNWLAAITLTISLANWLAGSRDLIAQVERVKHLKLAAGGVK